MVKINETKLKRIIGVFLITSHFCVIFLVVVLYAFDKFTDSELSTTIGLILPLFTAYTTAIIRQFLNEKSCDYKAQPELFPKIFVTFFIPSIFVLFIFSIIMWKSFGSLGFNSFTTLLGISETSFGGYVGMIVKEMFKS